MRVTPIAAASAISFGVRPGQVPRIYRVASRMEKGGVTTFVHPETVAASHMEHAVQLYCTKHELVRPTKYGNWLWRAYKHGVPYLIRCDSAASGAERNRV